MKIDRKGKVMLTDRDIRFLKQRGMDIEDVRFQIKILREGGRILNLKRPCALGDGIQRIDESRIDTLISRYEDAVCRGRCMKFVPASGAATRMFKSLMAYLKGEDGREEVEDFFKNIEKFAFYDDLLKVMERNSLDFRSLIQKRDYKTVLEFLLKEKGLGLSHLPKGLIRFHRYGNTARTPFEEHLLEAAYYVMDRDGNVQVHFTILKEHEGRIKRHIEEALKRFGEKAKFHVTFSFQAPSTDTVSMDLQGNLLRDEEGNLAFRPGGHGALLENLNSIGGDIVFIKNIDNVLSEDGWPHVARYKKTLGGILLEVQEEIHSYISKLNRETSVELLDQVTDFIKKRLNVIPASKIDELSLEKKREYLLNILNRPLRVCGMVKNVGEPGGGPFWIEEDDGSMSVQIVESAQINMEMPEQKRIWESSTHFNPVDIVCALRDMDGRSYDLRKFCDRYAWFVTIKSKDGVDIKAIERPGLWNGSMAYWNSVFVEVPSDTFSPVKKVLDLLRPLHQKKG